MGKRSAERRKLNVLECLKSLVLSRIDKVRNELSRRAGIEREMATRSSGPNITLRWFGHEKRMGEYRVARTVLMAEVSGGRVPGRLRFGWMM